MVSIISYHRNFFLLIQKFVKNKRITIPLEESIEPKFKIHEFKMIGFK